jgi:transposase-like protein
LGGRLGSSRSLQAAKDALPQRGLSRSEPDLDRVAAGLIPALDLRNSRPLDPDWLALFVDGQEVAWRDGDQLRATCIYLVVGLGGDGQKRVLSCIARPGRANREDGKSLLRGWRERGRRRVRIFLPDDFSGRRPLRPGFFPHAAIQRCAVPLQRHAQTHLSQAESLEFQQRWRALKSSWDVEVGNPAFEELCARFAQA